MYILGLDIGGTKCAAVTGSLDDGRITLIKKQSIETDHSVSAYEMLERLFDMADGILDKSPDAVGISCGGPLDSIRGVILSPPNLPGWDNIEIVRLAGEHFSCPVHLQNDANACAVAEWKFGAGRGFSNIAFLTFGTGLGAGIILNGRLFEGTNGNAGELGHIRLEKDGPTGFGKAGSFEGFCSGGGIAQLGRAFAQDAIKIGVTPLYASSGVDGITAKSIAEAAIAGDETAIKVYNTSGRYLGYGLSILIDILNPERIIIGGVFMRSHKLLWKSAEEELKKEALSQSLDVCKIVPSELGENIGDYGALATALL